MTTKPRYIPNQFCLPLHHYVHSYPKKEEKKRERDNSMDTTNTNPSMPVRFLMGEAFVCILFLGFEDTT